MVKQKSKKSATKIKIPYFIAYFNTMYQKIAPTQKPQLVQGYGSVIFKAKKIVKTHDDLTSLQDEIKVFFKFESLVITNIKRLPL